VTAIQIDRSTEGLIYAVNPDLEKDLDDIVSLSGACPRAVEYEGREYILYVTPYTIG
jgi:hypothetical protein